MGGRGARSGSSGARGRGVGAGGSGQGAGGAGGGAPVGTPQNPAPNGFTGTVDGSDITSSWTPPDSRRGAVQIESVMDAQGFRGKPQVMTDDAQFDQAVKDAWGGNGLILYRGYNAPDQATLDAYSDSLRSGDWYVQCGGGAVHGYGMYAAYAYGGKANYGYDSKAKNTATNYSRGWGSRPSKVETMTLHPSAKIGEESKIRSEMNAHNAIARQQRQSATMKRRQVTDPIAQQLSNGTRAEKAAAKAWQAGKQDASPRKGTTAKYQQEYNAAMGKLRKARDTVPMPALFSDTGVFAAAKGYDFYYDRRTGYSVVLNRTKLIIKD